MMCSKLTDLKKKFLKVKLKQKDKYERVYATRELSTQQRVTLLC